MQYKHDQSDHRADYKSHGRLFPFQFLSPLISSSPPSIYFDLQQQDSLLNSIHSLASNRPPFLLSLAGRRGPFAHTASALALREALPSPTTCFNLEAMAEGQSFNGEFVYIIPNSAQNYTTGLKGSNLRAPSFP